MNMCLCTNTLGFGFGSFTTADMLIILALGLLVFGKRLPEVGRSLGKGIVEFKKGLKGVEDEVEEQSNRPTRRAELPEERSSRPPAIEQDDRRVSRGDAVMHVPADQETAKPE